MPDIIWLAAFFCVGSFATHVAIIVSGNRKESRYKLENIEMKETIKQLAEDIEKTARRVAIKALESITNDLKNQEEKPK